MRMIAMWGTMPRHKRAGFFKVDVAISVDVRFIKVPLKRRGEFRKCHNPVTVVVMTQVVRTCRSSKLFQSHRPVMIEIMTCHEAFCMVRSVGMIFLSKSYLVTGRMMWVTVPVPSDMMRVVWGMRRMNLAADQLAVTVAVKGCQGIDRVGKFVRRDDSVCVDVKSLDDRRGRRAIRGFVTRTSGSP